MPKHNAVGREVNRIVISDVRTQVGGHYLSGGVQFCD